MERPSYVRTVRKLKEKEAEVAAEKAKAESARVEALEEAAAIVAVAAPECATEIRKAKTKEPGEVKPLPAKEVPSEPKKI